MPQPPVEKPYLLANNPQLDWEALEQRVADILADQHETLPASPPMPSHRAQAKPTILRRLLARAKGSRLVTQWLPRYPGLYWRLRTAYHWAKRKAGR